MKTITIKGKSYPIKFTMAALLEAEDMTGVGLNELFSGEGISSSHFFTFVYLALKHGADKARKKFHMTYNDVVDELVANEDLAAEATAVIVDDLKVIAEIMAERFKLNNHGENEAGNDEKKTRSGDITPAS